ncbi:MAG TPA: cytochrome d ubiquinol oxidase subunit II [Vicinamibacterales bacterium]|jgi:cytochrome d ubiquinol oxidase subunit II
MVEIWFVILCFMLIVFVVLDGWNIGAGALHLIVARSNRERREVVAAIGPLWSWHEVWLIAAGGTFVLAFPIAMAAAFSGFYLALWMVLWTFVLRGISIEVGGHIHEPMWQLFWDFVFAVSSLLLAVLFGAALGNVIRGVPLDSTARFAMELFTDFGVRGRVGILDWYTLSVAVFATVLLAAHGATYLRFKTEGVVHERSERLARGSWIAAFGLFPIVSVQTWIVRPEFYQAMSTRLAAWLFIAILLGGGWAVWTGLRGAAEARAFAGSCAIVAGLLGAAAASAFPELLHSTIAPQYSMTAHTAATTGAGLLAALFWWPVAAALAIAYFAVVMRKYRGKVRISQDSQGLY